MSNYLVVKLMTTRPVYTKYNDVLNELQDYMLDESRITKSIEFKLV